MMCEARRGGSVTGVYSHRVFKVTPAGAISEIIDATGDGTGNPLLFPYAVAADGSGNVYVTGLNSDNVFKVTPAGAVTEIIDATGDGIGNPLASPYGVAVDGSENVYITGAGSHIVFKVTGPYV